MSDDEGVAPYRTYASAEMVTAVGRALWNFLGLEEIIVAMLFESGYRELDEARHADAGGKVDMLRNARRRFSKEGAPGDLIAKVEAAIEEFDLARDEYRNALSHAVPFTVGYDGAGQAISGMSFTNSEGMQNVDAIGVHGLARAIEEAIDPLSEARAAIRVYRGMPPN